MAIPFPQAAALNTESLSSQQSSQPSSTTPAARTISHIPDEPTIPLSQPEVRSFLRTELVTTLLDELYPHLWLVAKQLGTHIDSLHQQRIKGRDVFAAEDPNLHLVWRRDRVYVKPLPVCVLNWHFWAEFLSGDAAVDGEKHALRAASTVTTAASTERAYALGLLRSYAFLIRHRSDFEIARERNLLPPDIAWLPFAQFIHHFRSIPDDAVAHRYRYGQLRVSRLNWTLRLFGSFKLRTASRWFVQLPAFSIVLFLQELLAPLVFVFANLSLVLSSMQILVAVPEDGLGLGALNLQAARRASWVFAVVVLVLSAVLWMLLVVVPLAGLGWQLSWGWVHRERKGGGRGVIP